MLQLSNVSIHASGQYPTLGRVGYGLPSFVDMREHVAREEWRKTLQQSGLDHDVTSTIKWPLRKAINGRVRFLEPASNPKNLSPSGIR